MAWFAWQSALYILLGFGLGAVVGWWFWRIQWRRVAFTESEAVTVISRRHERTVAEKDAELSRLQALLAVGAGGAAAGSSAPAQTAGGSHRSPTGSPPAEDPPDAAGSRSTSTSPDGSTDAAGASAGTSTEPGNTAPGSTGPGSTAQPAVAPADVTPAEVVLPDEPAAEAIVVDVTDDAVTDREVVAQAVAQLPTQSTGESDVIDLAALEGGPTADPGGDAAAESAGTDPDPGQDAVVDAATPAGDAAAGAAATGEAATEPSEVQATTSGSTVDPPEHSTVDTPEHSTEDTTAASGAVPAGGAPSDDATDGADGADDGAEDDLERIEGIGPRIASALRTSGIRSFRRLADADVPTLQAALEAAGLRFAPSLPTWSRQARFLADGDEVGFIKLTESLVAGREPGRSR